ncbi:GNAT family N-acetyltransferase [Sphingomonas daechungensis]|uniref:GNAT family N-acetyltransferase n=1 Tax=Sphingomonas daechungensis TaxID=1176646 RepID=UPI00294FF139|nr:GNAT family N-acetyltransferase [Sphingomonas daechungensis]
MEFRTKRLTLRPARESDLVAMHGILSDPRAMTYWSSLPHDRIEQTWDWLASMLAIPPSEGEDFVVELGGKLIGKAGLWRFPEIGFIFHPDYWGRGYAREALEFVLDRAFGVHQLPAVTADVDPVTRARSGYWRGSASRRPDGRSEPSRSAINGATASISNSMRRTGQSANRKGRRFPAGPPISLRATP